MNQVVLRSLEDLSEALSISLEHGGAIVTEQNLSPDFFNLRTGFAGELLQKFVNYRARLAIVLPDTTAHGERFAELVYEHRRHPAVRFFANVHDAQEWLRPQA